MIRTITREKTGTGLALCLLLLTLCPANGAQNTHLQKGLELFQQEHYAEALQEFEQARRDQPANAAIENAIGITATKLGRIDEANQHYENAIRLNQKSAEPHKNLGVNCLTSKRYEAAEQHLKTAASLNRNDPFVHFYLAMLYLETSRDKEAVEHLAPAGQLLGNDPAVAFQMAKACLRLNRTADALNLVTALEQRSALSSRDEYELAVLMYSKGLYVPAIEQFRRIGAADPGSWASKYNLAVALLAAKETGEAMRLLEPLAAQRPHDANILSILGSAYEAAGRLPQALDAYQKAARADPENPDRYLDYSRLLMDLDRYDQSEQFVREGLEHVPDAYALIIRLGSVQMMSGNYAEARRSFQKAIEAHPEIAVGYAGVARAWFKEGQHEEAAKVLAAAQEKVLPDFAIEYYYGLALANLGRTGEAVEAFKRAARLNPKVPEARYELGKLYFALGQTEAAKAEFEQVIHMAPRHSNAHYQLSRVYARLGDAAQAHAMAVRTRELKEQQREVGLAAQRARFKDFQPVQPQ